MNIYIKCSYKDDKLDGEYIEYIEYKKFGEYSNGIILYKCTY